MKKEKIIAVYAGTFDPLTYGHLDMIERSSKMFDIVYVTILENIHKKTLLTLEERLALLRESTKDYTNVVVDASDALAVEYARSVGATVLVRGLRATMDFEYEMSMALANQYLDAGIETIFLLTKSERMFVSSSTVKEIAYHHHSVEDLVPPCVNQALIKKMKEQD